MKASIHKTLILTIIFTLLVNGLSGQISQGGIPFSFDPNIKQLKINGQSLNEAIPILQMPQVSQSKIDSIMEMNKHNQRAFQFAYVFNVNINVKDTSFFDSLKTGLLYRLGIESTNAKSINLIFKEFVIPPGAKLFIFSKDRKDVKGAFSDINNKSSKKLAITPIKGDEIRIEYFEPYHPVFTGVLKISKIGHDFLGVYGRDGGFGLSGDCEVDVNCSEGDNWQNEKRAVCRILIDGSAYCTGSMINNSNSNGTPYFLTANHCICDQDAAENSVFVFNYESPTCDGIDGSVSQSIDGADLVATRGESDFTLLELSSKPPAGYYSYYLGWDRNTNQNSGGVGIHHPMGDVKKISTYTMTPTDAECVSGSDNVGCGAFNRSNDDYYKILFTNTTNGHGVTEGGSSGSPLLNNNHRIIGQLYGYDCNGPMCDDPANDESCYGKFSSSWNDGGSSSTRLRDWLDPGNSITVLPGLRHIEDATIDSDTPCSGDIVKFSDVSVQASSDIEVDYQNSFEVTGTFNAPTGTTLYIHP